MNCWFAEASKEAKIFLGVNGGKSSQSLQCHIADLERLDLFREKILAVGLRETLEQKKVLIEEDGYLSIDLTFVAQMFPQSASQPDGRFPFVYSVQAPDLLSENPIIFPC